MASNDTAALVVALSAQVSKFQKDMDQAFGIADKAVKKIESRFDQVSGTITNKLGGAAQTAASRLGLIGDVLTALGPVGLGVAASVGALALAYVTVAEKVDAFAEKAKRLKDAAETTGLTITQLRLLSTAGKAAGLDFEETEKFIERLTLALNELSTKGSGALFEQVLRRNVNVVRELAAAAGDTARQIDILAKFTATLTNQQEKNAVVAAIAGKRNLAGGRLLDIVDEKGGIKGLQQDAIEAGRAIDEELIEKIRKIKLNIEAIKSRTENIYGSMFSLEVLGHQEQSALFWERIANAIANAKTASESFERTNSQASQFGRRFRGADIPFVAGKEEGKLTADQLLRAGQARLAQQQQIPGGAPSVPAPLPRPDIAGAVPASVELELMKKWTSVLGEAITPTEQFKLKVLELAAAQEKGGVSDQIRARALAAFALSQGAAALSVRERLGVAREEEITEQRLRELNDSRAKGFVKNAGEMAIAERIIAREAKASAEALQVRASRTPDLTRALLDAQNAAKQFDQIATNAFNSAGDAFADVVTGTKNVKDAMRDMVNSILRDLSRAAFKSLFATLLGGGTGGGIFGGIFGGARAGGGPVSSGNVFAVGEQGPELFVPRSAGTIIPNDVLRRGDGGTPQIFITNHVDATGADVATVSRLTAALLQVNRSIEQRAIAAMSTNRMLRA